MDLVDRGMMALHRNLAKPKLQGDDGVEAGALDREIEVETGIANQGMTAEETDETGTGEIEIETETETAIAETEIEIGIDMGGTILTAGRGGKEWRIGDTEYKRRKTLQPLMVSNSIESKRFDSLMWIPQLTPTDMCIHVALHEHGAPTRPGLRFWQSVYLVVNGWLPDSAASVHHVQVSSPAYMRSFGAPTSMAQQSE